MKSGQAQSLFKRNGEQYNLFSRRRPTDCKINLKVCHRNILMSGLGIVNQWFPRFLLAGVYLKITSRGRVMANKHPLHI